MAFFIIDSKALFYNVAFYKSKLRSGVLFCAMVKADAYGHSAKRISKLIEKEVDYFGVATIKEGLELRKYGIKKPILVVGDFDTKQIKLAYINNIELTIHNKVSMERVLKSNLKLNVHLKINTGMNRLGFKSVKEFKAVYEKLKNNCNVTIKGIFSHILSGQYDENSNLQKQRFDKFIKLIDTENIILHIANSENSLEKNMQYDMVRIGIGIYGYGNKNLKPILKIVSNIIQISDVKRGEYVGYSKKYKAEKNIKVGMVFLGYYDGINRKLSGEYVIINNKKYKVIGNVCMDMFMVEVDDSISCGDEVIVFTNAEEWAKKDYTIPYEILTRLKYDRCKYIIKK